MTDKNMSFSYFEFCENQLICTSARCEDVKRGKFNVTIGNDAIIGVVGDRNTVTQHIGTKL